ncbi:cytidylyltransferase domain-containing protein [Psychrobium sp. nBUS_13]|uniref:acylneuraminate cytidylyltransferase family protein n=1 Tax=Psychrobium sp. nBUS_13 TaxID=3395319 RepID=UPI003EBC8BA5
MNSKVLGLILARGGSKRLPRKNIKNLHGKPLINWTIEAAINSSCIDDVVVSTDCENIANVAREAGANVPFLRDKELAQDTSSSTDAAIDAVSQLADIRKYYDYIALLQPTSPLRTAFHIEQAFNILRDNSATAVVSVCKTEHSPLWCNTLNESASLDNFLPKNISNIRSQDLPTYYRLNGAIYIIKSDVLMATKTFFPNTGGFAYVMPTQASIDIDTKLDFITAQAVMTYMENKNDE